jgi:hypothetical protein
MMSSRHHNHYVDRAACFWTSSIVERHENPVRRGLGERAGDWEFSSASWYAYGTGPITIDAVDGW